MRGSPSYLERAQSVWFDSLQCNKSVRFWWRPFHQKIRLQMEFCHSDQLFAVYVTCDHNVKAAVENGLKFWSDCSSISAQITDFYHWDLVFFSKLLNPYIIACCTFDWSCRTKSHSYLSKYELRKTSALLDLYCQQLACGLKPEKKIKK